MPAPLAKVAPFISHIAIRPSVWRNKRSALPSPLKSAVWVTVQPEAASSKPAPLIKVVPFMSQTATLPSVWRNKISDLPSPLKSATWVTLQPVPASIRPAPLTKVAPFISHIAIRPSVWRNKRSALPSPLKSAIWVTAQPGALSKVFLLKTLAPSIIQSSVNPLLVLTTKSLLESLSKSLGAACALGLTIRQMTAVKPTSSANSICLARKRRESVAGWCNERGFDMAIP